jgi:hypothetical protein
MLDASWIASRCKGGTEPNAALLMTVASPQQAEERIIAPTALPLTKMREDEIFDISLPQLEQNQL